MPIYDDVRTLTAERLAADGIAVDVITGGFPCQDISVAGNQAGISEGTRSGLWSECLRLVSELRPQYAIFENVANLLAGPAEKPGAWFSRILADLASVRYDAEWENIPASAVGAPHRRERIWIVANAVQSGWGFLEEPPKYILESLRTSWPTNARSAGLAVHNRKEVCAPEFVLLADGFPGKLGDGLFAGFGNAVVPQIPELIGHAILESMK